MSKIGVGVGDDFPVDDGNKPKANTDNTNTGNANAGGTEPPRDDRAEFEDWKRRRDAHRAQREQWRAQRDEWHRRKQEWKAQWQDHKRAWRDEARANFGEGIYSGPNGDFAYPMGGRRGYGRRRFRGFSGGHGLARMLGLLLAIVLIVFAVTHIGYIIAGLVAVGALFAAYHYFGHDPLDFRQYDQGPRDYARPVNNPPPAPTQAVAKPADNNTNNTGPQNT